jgi:hypothetical protein
MQAIEIGAAIIVGADDFGVDNFKLAEPVWKRRPRSRQAVIE